jgi:hypothetical protein
MRPWQRLWLVLTILWGVPWGCMLANNPPSVHLDLAGNLYAWAFVVGIPSAAVYLVLWAIAGLFSQRK